MPDNDALIRQISLIRAIESSASNGVHLRCGNGDIALELTPEEVEEHVRPLLQARKGRVGMQIASKPQERAPLILGSDHKPEVRKDPNAWRY